jgi:hypothetical protein
VEGDDGRGWELTEGGNQRWRRWCASDGRPWTGGRGRSGTHVVLAKEEERERKKGAGGIGDTLLKGSGGKQWKKGWSGIGVCVVE